MKRTVILFYCVLFGVFCSMCSKKKSNNEDAGNDSDTEFFTDPQNRECDEEGGMRCYSNAIYECRNGFWMKRDECGDLFCIITDNEAACVHDTESTDNGFSDADGDTDSNGDTGTDTGADTSTEESTDTDTSDTDSENPTDTDSPFIPEDEISPLEDWYLTIDPLESSQWPEWLGGFASADPLEWADWVNIVDTTDPLDLTAAMAKEIYFPCLLTVKGVQYKECEVRLSGESSMRYPKYSVRIRFPESDVINHPGYNRKMTLKAQYDDPSFIREFLSYLTFSRLTELPTPRVRFVNLYVNGNRHGLMLYAERIGGNFLKTNGLDRDRIMIESDPPQEVVSMGAGAFIPLNEATDVPYNVAYDIKTGIDESDYSELIYFIEDVIWPDFQGNSTTHIEQEVHMDSFVDYLSVLGLIQDFDHSQKNLYCSRQQLPGTDAVKWVCFPYDHNLSFGCMYNPGAEDTICEKEYVTAVNSYFPGMHQQDLSPFYGDMLFYNLLTHTTLWDTEYWDMLENRICDMMHSRWWKEDIFTATDYTESMISDSVAADTNDLNETLAEFQDWVDTVTGFIDDRTAFLEGELQCPGGSPEVIPDTLHLYWDRGIPSDAALWNWGGGDYGELAECSVTPPEGVRCYEVSHYSWIGWGVFMSIGQDNGMNISNCSNLAFELYVTDSADEITVEIQRTTSQGSKYGYTLSGLQTGWQSISIPMEEFTSSPGNLEHVFGPFLITIAPSGSFKVDNVRWQNCSV